MPSIPQASVGTPFRDVAGDDKPIAGLDVESPSMVSDVFEIEECVVIDCVVFDADLGGSFSDRTES